PHPHLHSFPTRRSSDLVDPINASGLLTGWALDKNLGIDAATVNLYVDDQFSAMAPANLPRTDAGRPSHGFSFDISSLGTAAHAIDRKSTRLNSSHVAIS